MFNGDKEGDFSPIFLRVISRQIGIYIFFRWKATTLPSVHFSLNASVSMNPQPSVNASVSMQPSVNASVNAAKCPQPCCVSMNPQPLHSAHMSYHVHPQPSQCVLPCTLTSAHVSYRVLSLTCYPHVRLNQLMQAPGESRANICKSGPVRTCKSGPVRTSLVLLKAYIRLI